MPFCTKTLVGLSTLSRRCWISSMCRGIPKLSYVGVLPQQSWKKDIFFRRRRGHCRLSKLPLCSRLAFDTGPQYIGCYADVPSARIFELKIDSSDSMTVSVGAPHRYPATGARPVPHAPKVVRIVKTPADFSVEASLDAVLEVRIVQSKYSIVQKY